MSQIDTSTDHVPDTPSGKSRAFRWIIRLSLVVCAMLMALVLLSQPRVFAAVQHNIETVLALLPQNQETASAQTSDIAPEAPAERAFLGYQESDDANARPAVRAMPSNQIPVRRAGVSVAD
jgi:hypothetical protein